MKHYSKSNKSFEFNIMSNKNECYFVLIAIFIGIEKQQPEQEQDHKFTHINSSHHLYECCLVRTFVYFPFGWLKNRHFSLRISAKGQTHQMSQVQTINLQLCQCHLPKTKIPICVRKHISHNCKRCVVAKN